MQLYQLERNNFHLRVIIESYPTPGYNEYVSNIWKKK